MLIYWLHRLVHTIYIPFVHEWHMDHHRQVTQDALWGLHWSNVFLYNDTWKSTFDLWAIEIIPTLIFCWLTGHWWLFIIFYIWTAFIQEAIEHNENFDWFPYLTSGRWHLIHHKNSRVNFGLLTPIWDLLFKSYKN